MIDEDRTLQIYGYTSDELSPKSGEKIVVVCEECGKYRITQKYAYRDLCRTCSNKCRKLSEEARIKMGESHKGKKHTEETKRKIGDTHKGRKHSEEARQKMSDASKGKKHSEETKQKMSKSKQNIAEESRIKMSCSQQGISRKDFDGFVTESPYCPKFNESCREKNREKYGRECFICGKSGEENGRKLSVHHVDMNKQQGCNSDWKLVPLCQSCHARAHNDLWQSRIEYLLKSKTFKV